MEKSEIISSGTTRNLQLIKKKSARKPATVTKVIVKTEIIDNEPVPTQNVQPMKCASNSSTVVNAIEHAEIIHHGAAPTQSSQPIKIFAVKPEVIDSGTSPTQSSQPIKIIAGKPEIVSGTTPTQSAQPIKIFAEKPEMVDSDTAPTQSSQPIKIFVGKSEIGTAPTESGQSVRKKTVRKHKPYKIVKRGTNQNALKKDHFKAPRPVFIPVASETLNYKNSLFTRGDIVSVVDSDDRVYYAQIRGLLQNQYCEKSAVLTWLFPTTESPIGQFDPQTYILGHEEDIPRDLEYLEFVCHAPSEYYKSSNPSYPEFTQKPDLGFAQTRKGYVIVKLPCEDFSTDSE